MGVICGGLMEKYDILKNLVVEMLFNPHLQKLMLVKLKLLYTFLSPRKFPIL